LLPLGILGFREHLLSRRNAMKKRLVLSLIVGIAVLAALTAVPLAQAGTNSDTISINFGADEGGGNASLNPTDVAGVVPSANWNNAEKKGGVMTALTRDTNGVAATTGAAVLWECTNTWASKGRGEENNKFDQSTGDYTLMTGYLDQNTSTPSPTFVQIRNLPDDIATGTYDVYIYALGGVPGRGGEYTVNNVGPLYLIAGGDTGQFNSAFHQAAGTDPGYGSDDFGNYLEFKAQSGPVVTITATNFIGGGAPRAVINGVQIVRNQ
jgi:hypothetical protein